MKTTPSFAASYSLGWVFIMVVAFLCFGVSDAMAGPGGEIVEFAFKTKVGRILFGIVALIFLPLIVYVVVREKLGERRTRKDLARLAEESSYFDWERLEVRIHEAAKELYGCWSSGNLSPARSYLTETYFSSQQDILDRWKDEGKRNVCRMDELKKLRPLFVQTETEDSYSTVGVLLKMNLLDFMQSTRNFEKLKGSEDVHEDHEVIWIMVNQDGQWLLNAIEEGSNSLVMASQKNEIDLPALRQAQAASALDSAPHDLPAEVPAEEIESAGVEQAEDEQSK